MPDGMSIEDAKKQVVQLRIFFLHLAIYCAVMVLLLVVNLLTTPGYLWFLWALCGWGLGVLIHGAWAYYGQGLVGKDWEERKIRELTSARKDEE